MSPISFKSFSTWFKSLTFGTTKPSASALGVANMGPADRFTFDKFIANVVAKFPAEPVIILG